MLPAGSYPLSGSISVSNDAGLEKEMASTGGLAKRGLSAELAIKSMPDWLAREINHKGIRIADWGCDDGKSTSILAKAFPKARLWGIDASGASIERASKRYPHLSFCNEDWLQSNSPAKPVFDILFLLGEPERFPSLFDLLSVLSPRFGRLAVILIRPDEQWRASSPEHFGGFPKIPISPAENLYVVVCRIIDSGMHEALRGSGQRVLLVYLRSGDALWRGLTLGDISCTTTRSDMPSARTASSVKQGSNSRDESFGDKYPRAALGPRGRLPNADLNWRLNSKEAELRALQASLDEVLQSKSWRLTAPLRSGMRCIGRFRRYLASLLGRGRFRRYKRRAKELEKDSSRISDHRRSLFGSLKEVRVAAIMDTFTRNCLAPECDLICIRPDDWRALLSQTPPDLLFVESAWKGNEGAWEHRVAVSASGAAPGRELASLVEWCRDKGIPTVFWNKEDPPHFNDFIQSACQFDWIFTTDANCIEGYRRRCGHDRVFALPFAAQPEIHRPVLSRPRNRKVCFAGAYYGDRFDARRDAMELLLRPALDFDLDIFDRMFGVAGPGAEACRFPDEYVPRIVGRLEYRDMVEAYKRYRVFLNVNSVSDSPTMFSRRVFELLACGTPVVSTESLGIRTLFPGIVPIVTNPQEARAAIAKLVEDEAFWLRCSALGIRRVMQFHTYRHRLRQICETVGLGIENDERTWNVVLVVQPGSEPDLTAAQIADQSVRPVAIYVLSNRFAQALDVSLGHLGLGVSSRIIDQPSEAIAQERDALAAFIDGNHSYGPGYLLDALMALRYSGASCTSMTAFFQASKNGGIELNTALGTVGTLSKRVNSACFVSTASHLNAEVMEKLLAADSVGLDKPCYARTPFEFLAGGAFSSDDPRLEDVTLSDCPEKPPKFHRGSS